MTEDTCRPVGYISMIPAAASQQSRVIGFVVPLDFEIIRTVSGVGTEIFLFSVYNFLIRSNYTQALHSINLEHTMHN